MRSDKSKPSRVILFELALVMLATFALYILLPQVRGLALFLPVMYVLIERQVRNRPWNELGIVRRGFVEGIVSNWHLFFAVAIVIQIVVPLAAVLVWPEYLQQILSRLPWSPSAGVVALLAFLLLTAFSVFIEELVFRGLVQERLGWFIPQAIAIIIASVLFGLIHWGSGNTLATLADVSGVVLDGLFYGAVYARSRSVVVSWTVHFFSDIVGLTMLLLLRG
jgi:membrane protease YdiL (CAAX protease family)